MAESWGLSDTGYYCPTFDEIVEEKIQLAKNLFGDDIVTDELTALGKLIRIQAAADHKLYEEQEKLYYSLSPETATGISLDRLCALVGIKRKSAICAIHTIRVFGSQGYVIPAGTLFRSAAGIKFYTTVASSITDYEGNINDVDRYYAEVTVQCVDAGISGNVYTINAPVLVNNSIEEVQYYNTIQYGENVESDIELRKRFNIAADGSGNNTTASIIAAVINIEGVHDCKIKNNTTDSDIIISNSLTVAAGTYAVIVYANGNLDDKIASAIYQKMPLGVPQSGVNTVIVTDAADEEHIVKFTNVDEITVNVSVTCNVSSSYFPRNGAAQIRNNIQTYINSLEVGEDLILSQLYSCIYRVAGVTRVTDLTINGDTDDITATLTDIIHYDTVSVTVVQGA